MDHSLFVADRISYDDFYDYYTLGCPRSPNHDKYGKQFNNHSLHHKKNQTSDDDEQNQPDYYEEYSNDNNIYKDSIAQLQLLLSEIRFLTKYHSEGRIIIYAGASPGYHISYLSSLFPKHIFHLYDPCEFGNNLLNHPRIHCHRECFTNKLANELGRKYGNSKDGDGILFISDIQTTSPDLDNKCQKEWVELMKPARAMLKFRLPFHGYHPQFHNDDTIHLDGEIWFQSFTYRYETETRLIPYCDDNGEYTITKSYNHCQYADQLSYVNEKTNNAFIENEFHDSSIGFAHNFDCWSFGYILRKYIQDVDPPKSKIIEMIYDIFDNLNISRDFLLTKINNNTTFGTGNNNNNDNLTDSENDGDYGNDIDHDDMTPNKNANMRKVIKSFGSMSVANSVNAVYPSFIYNDDHKYSEYPGYQSSDDQMTPNTNQNINSPNSTSICTQNKITNSDNDGYRSSSDDNLTRNDDKCIEMNTEMYAYITLVMKRDNYIRDALVLARSLRSASTKYPLIVMVTNDISDKGKAELKILYDYVVNVDGISDSDEGFFTQFTKWNTSFINSQLNMNFAKLLYLDCEQMVNGNIDHVFDTRNTFTLDNDQLENFKIMLKRKWISSENSDHDHDNNCGSMLYEKSIIYFNHYNKIAWHHINVSINCVSSSNAH